MKSQLQVELLTATKENQEQIKSFLADKHGKALETYLKEAAWEEDKNGGTKVYLVKDKQSKQIVFFFALKAGLLYKNITDDDYNLSEKEREIVMLCIEYYLNEENTLTEEEIFSWYEDEGLDKDKLRRVIQEKIKVKLTAKSDRSKTEEGDNIMRVSKTFPGIVLTHLCKGTDDRIQPELSFPLGFYIFWEIVVEKVLYIASLIGCQYLYLFAADHTEAKVELPSLNDLIYMDLEDEPEQRMPTYKLVEYYKNELKFEEVQNLVVLKPSYDFECFSLIQSIADLVEHRNAAWIQHSEIDNV